MVYDLPKSLLLEKLNPDLLPAKDMDEITSSHDKSLLFSWLYNAMLFNQTKDK